VEIEIFVLNIAICKRSHVEFYFLDNEKGYLDAIISTPLKIFQEAYFFNKIIFGEKRSQRI
jgi:hypothetical protein